MTERNEKEAHINKMTATDMIEARQMKKEAGKYLY